ncbi:hypothetical protein Srubr_43230 [Streptomyces rubradiris]|uniref:Uncharacterized protein n=1 Tax=Streptomyces rubradiris TaxID=285531 RepID=A0ABQ3RF23_STRRR|nr:hypothetical protein GCM10018792_09050 [Streptomyces rubradiris]GHI54477.1 hypothetical protein Srubr_43230 [Streptomyces rubradiris]
MAAQAVAATETRDTPARPRRAAGPPVAFGGPVAPGRPHCRVSEPSGPARAAPRPLPVASGTGPGGRAVAPVRPIGYRSLDAAVAVARDVGQALVVGDEERESPAGVRSGRAGCRLAGGARGVAGAGGRERRTGADRRVRGAGHAAMSRGRDPGATRTGRAVLGGGSHRRGGGRAVGHRPGDGREASASGDAESGRPHTRGGGERGPGGGRAAVARRRLGNLPIHPAPL